MTKYMEYEKNGNLKNRILSLPVRVSHVDFDELYGEISDNWQDKAQKLQIRRMRKIKRQAI